MQIINVMASSLDGYIASSKLETDEDRAKYGLTSDADRTHLKNQLFNADAVVTGADSVRASKRIWNITNYSGRPAHWFVLTDSGLSSDLEFWQQDDVARTLVSSKSVPIFDKGVENLVLDSQKMILNLVKILSKRRMRNVLLFGGSKVNRQFYSLGLVDVLKLTLCPTLMGTNTAIKIVESELPEFIEFELLSLEKVENHLFLTYNVKKKIPNSK